MRFDVGTLATEVNAVHALVVVVIAAAVAGAIGWYAGRLRQSARPRATDDPVALSYRALVQHSPYCIHEFDHVGRFRMINPAGLRMLGVAEPNQALSMRYSDLAAPAEVAKLDQLFDAALDGECSEFEFETREGRTFQSNFVPLTDAGGSVAGVMGVTVDVTEYRRAQQLTEARRLQFQSILDAMDIFVGLYAPDGTVIELNKRLVDALGTERRKSATQPFWDLYPWTEDEESRLLVMAAFQKAAQGEIARQSATVRLQGRELTVDAIFSPIFDAGGQVVQVVGTGTDVTERRQIETMLADRQAKLAEAQRVSKTGSWELDIPTGQLTWSDEVFRIFALDRENFEPSYEAFLNAIHPDDREAVDRAYTESLETGEPYEIRHRLLMADGSIKYVHERCETYLDADGRPLRSVGTVQDITERAMAEKALEESEAMFRAMVESSPEGVLVTDESGKIIIVNGETETMFGYTRAELIGQTVEMLIPGRFSGHSRYRKEYTKRPSIRTMSKAINLYGQRKDGTEFPVEIGLSPIVIEGRVSTVATIRDLTDRKAAEAKFREAQKLESLGLLAGGIAHDFNNLLVAVMGNIDLALHDSGIAGAPARFLNNAIQSAQTAADLCRQLLAYSGKGKFVIETVDLSEVVTAMARLLEVSIGTNCTIRYRFDASLPGIDVDVTQLRQIVMNLITNASDAIGDAQGVISVRTGSTVCDREYLELIAPDVKLDPGEFVYLEITDTGGGMPPETIERIFEPFFTTKASGRGLGLSAVRGIVRSHGGALRVYSEVGIGTAVRVFFPASKSKARSIPADAGYLDNWRGRGTVLVIDDVESILLVARTILEKTGFSVLTAAGGREGLDLYQEHHREIVAVLLDMTMPDMNGEETFVELRRINPGVRVVLSSGYNEQDATMNFTGKGLAGFVHKPYRSIDLIRAMHRVLEGDAAAEL